MILLTAREEIHPVLQRIMGLFLRLPPLLLLQRLQLPRCVQRIDFAVVERDEHLFHAAHVGRDIDVETVRYEGPRCVGACEEVVGAAGAVVATAGGDIVDCAVDGEEDGDVGVGVGAVEGFEVRICVLFWS